MKKTLSPVKKNQELEVEVIDLSYQAYGVAKIDGFSIFIENTLPGETVKIRIEKVEKRFAFGKLLEIIKESEDRVPLTDLIGTRIGTMPLQHLAYPKQLEFKQKMVQDAFAMHFKEPITIEPTLGMENPWNYRNKAQIPVQEIKGVLETGFFKRGTHSLIPVENYHIQEEEIDAAILVIRNILRKHNVAAYDEETHTGFIRHVIVRRGHYTHEMMIILVTRIRDFSQRNEVVRDILDELPNTVSIIQNINEKRSNVIMGDDQIVLFGEDVYYDKLMDKTFAISSKSFFQVNSVQTEVLYSKAIEFADISKDDVVIDAYCGIGTISLIASDKAKHVYGVEVVPDAITMAKRNASLNSISNVTFEVGQAEDVMIRWANEGMSADVMIVDPPRKGLDEKFIEGACKARPKRIVYVSCNPYTLARDAKMFVENGYQVETVQPVDMFPHTVHVENVVLLQYRKGE